MLEGKGEEGRPIVWEYCFVLLCTRDLGGRTHKRKTHIISLLHSSRYPSPPFLSLLLCPFSTFYDIYCLSPSAPHHQSHSPQGIDTNLPSKAKQGTRAVSQNESQFKTPTQIPNLLVDALALSFSPTRREKHQFKAKANFKSTHFT